MLSFEWPVFPFSSHAPGNRRSLLRSSQLRVPDARNHDVDHEKKDRQFSPTDLMWLAVSGYETNDEYLLLSVADCAEM